MAIKHVDVLALMDDTHRPNGLYINDIVLGMYLRTKKVYRRPTMVKVLLAMEDKKYVRSAFATDQGTRHKKYLKFMQS